MGIIPYLLPLAAQQERLHAAIRDRHELVSCTSWQALLDVVQRRAVRVLVADLFASGNLELDEVRQLRERSPRIAIIAYSQFTPNRALDLFDAGRAGVDALVLMDVNDAPRTLLAFVELAEVRSLAGAVGRALRTVCNDTLVVDAVLLAVTRAHERLGPAGLAKLLAVSRETLQARLARAGFPPPRRLLTWGQLIVAASLLEDRRRTAEQTALSIGFPSGGSFRNTCQRYLHATPRDIRERGGAEYVIRGLLRQVVRDGGDLERPRHRARGLAVIV